MSTFDQILQRLRPNVRYSNRDGTLANVVWEEGVVPPTQEEYDAEEISALIPQEALSGDFIHALHDLGWINDVKAAVAAAGGLAEDLFLHASKYERHHPLMLQIAQAIGKDSDDLDELFLKTLDYL
jgi:hypothetical protein